MVFFLNGFSNMHTQKAYYEISECYEFWISCKRTARFSLNDKEAANILCDLYGEYKKSFNWKTSEDKVDWLAIVKKLREDE